MFTLNCSAVQICKHLNGSKYVNVQKLSIPDTLMSLLIDPPTHRTVLNFWVCTRVHSNVLFNFEWGVQPERELTREREESPWGDITLVPHFHLDLEYICQKQRYLI